MYSQKLDAMRDSAKNFLSCVAKKIFSNLPPRRGRFLFSQDMFEAEETGGAGDQQ